LLIQVITTATSKNIAPRNLLGS